MKNVFAVREGTLPEFGVSEFWCETVLQWGRNGDVGLIWAVLSCIVSELSASMTFCGLIAVEAMAIVCAVDCTGSYEVCW